MSTSVSSKLNIARFSSILEKFTDFGNTLLLPWQCYRRITCAADRFNHLEIATITASSNATPPHMSRLQASTKIPASEQYSPTTPC